MALADIFRASWEGDVDTVQTLLVGDSAAVTARDTSDYGGGFSALHYAAYGGHSELCALLIARGAAINALTADGLTSVLLAAQQGRLETVALLLSSGADPTGVSSVTSCGILDLAFDRPDIMELLRTGALPVGVSLPALSGARSQLPKCGPPARPPACPTLTVTSCVVAVTGPGGAEVCPPYQAPLLRDGSGGSVTVRVRRPRAAAASSADGDALLVAQLTLKCSVMWPQTAQPPYLPLPAASRAAAAGAAVPLPPSKYEIAVLLKPASGEGAAEGAEPTVLFRGALPAARPPPPETDYDDEQPAAATASKDYTITLPPLTLPAPLVPRGDSGGGGGAAGPLAVSAAVRLVACVRGVNTFGRSPWSAPSAAGGAAFVVVLDPLPGSQQQQAQAQEAVAAEEPSVEGEGAGGASVAEMEASEEGGGVPGDAEAGGEGESEEEEGEAAADDCTEQQQQQRGAPASRAAPPARPLPPAMGGRARPVPVAVPMGAPAAAALPPMRGAPASARPA